MLASHAASDRASPLPFLRFLPLPLLQPILSLIGTQVAKNQPDVFLRLGPHASKTFIIDPTDIPFLLVLKPRPEAPSLSAWRRATRSRSCPSSSVSAVRSSSKFMVKMGVVGSRRLVLLAGHGYRKHRGTATIGV